MDSTGPRILDSQGLLVSPPDQPIPRVEPRVESAEPCVESVMDAGTPRPHVFL